MVVEWCATVVCNPESVTGAVAAATTTLRSTGHVCGESAWRASSPAAAPVRLVVLRHCCSSVSPHLFAPSCLLSSSILRVEETAAWRRLPHGTAPQRLVRRAPLPAPGAGASGGRRQDRVPPRIFRSRACSQGDGHANS